MKTRTTLLCAAFAAISPVIAQEAKPEVKPAAPAEVKAAQPTTAEPTAPMDKVSYFIGRNMGTQFKGQDIAIDIENFTAGVKSAMSGEKPKFTEQELMAAMQAFEGVMQAKAQKEQAAQMAEAAKAKEEGIKFLAENGKKKGVTTTKSGLQYEVIKEGSGPKPAATDQVQVHYHGTLVNGKVFDSSVERGEPITFPLQGVIKGWTEGVQLMATGSKFRFFIPSDLAYGENGAGDDIGPGATLIFEVELLGIVK